MSLKYKPNAVNGREIPDHGGGANGLTDFLDQRDGVHRDRAGGAPAIIALPVVADFPSLHEFRHFMRDQGLAVPLRRVLSALSEHSVTAVKNPLL
jgi:hypothetical protein